MNSSSNLDASGNGTEGTADLSSHDAALLASIVESAPMVTLPPSSLSGLSSTVQGAHGSSSGSASSSTMTTTTTTSAPAAPPTVAVPSAAAVGAIAREPRSTRTALSIHEKSIVKTFCEQRVGECKARGSAVPSQDALRQEIAAKFGWEVGRSTLSKILSLDWQRLDADHHPNPNMKRKRKPLFPAFEADLVRAVRAHVLGGGGQVPQGPMPVGMNAIDTPPAAVLTEAVILEEAQRLKQQHGIKDEELVLSVGWLARFKHRNGIRLRKTPSTTASGTNEPLSTTYNGSIHVHPQQLQPHQHCHPGDAMLMTHSMTSGSSHNKRVKIDGESERDGYHFAPLPEIYDGGSSLTSTMALVQLAQTCELPCLERPTSATIATIAEGLPPTVRAVGCRTCPSIVPDGIRGLHVVVIGYQCVRDAFIASAAVGPTGSVTCMEIQPEAAAFATSFVSSMQTWESASANLRIVHGPSMSSSDVQALVTTQDLVLFNCAFRLASAKMPLLELAFSMLREGGECQLSYLGSDRRPHPRVSVTSSESSLKTSAPGDARPASMPTELVSVSSGAESTRLSVSVYHEDFRRMCQRVGFLDPRFLPQIKLMPREDDGSDGAPREEQVVVVVPCRLFKLRLVEDRPEDYGQRAVFLGGEDGSAYELDSRFIFHKGAVPVAIDGNTAEILRASWVRRYFDVLGDRSQHRGKFEP